MVDTASASDVTRESGRVGQRRRPFRQRLGRAATPLLWIGPAIALIAVVVLWPVVVMFRTSFQHFSPNGFLSLSPIANLHPSEKFTDIRGMHANASMSLQGKDA